MVLELLFLCVCLPPVLLCFRLVSPLLTNDLGDVRISKTWVLSDHGSLAVLAIKDESVSRSGKLGLRLAQTKVDH